MLTKSKVNSRSPLTRALTVACTFLLCAFLPTLAAQQPISFADAAQQGQALFQQSAFTGMVLVVVRNQQVLIKGYGETAPGNGIAPNAHSLIRLCSLSKVLTADLLARLAAQHKVKLDDPLDRYAPPGKLVPQGPHGTRITLINLATHTASLPREVAAYPGKTPHFTFPSYTYRWDWLPKQTLKTPPGTAALYSNIGFDLLGDALAASTHKSYAQLLHQSLLQPLEMNDTTLVPSVQQCTRLLQGSRDEGPCTSTEPSGPSGGVYSTPADMVKFLQYLLQLPGAPPQPASALDIYLSPGLLKSVEGLSHAGDPSGIGLAWIQLGDPATPSALLEKTGGGAGFSTYIALNLPRHTAIFVAATEGKGRSKVDFFHEANNLLAALANVPPLPPRQRPAPAPKRHPTPRRRNHTVPKSSP